MVFAVHIGNGFGHFTFNSKHAGHLAQYVGRDGFDDLGNICSLVIGQVQPHLLRPHVRGHGGQYFCIFMLQYSWYSSVADCDDGINWKV